MISWLPPAGSEEKQRKTTENSKSDPSRAPSWGLGPCPLQTGGKKKVNFETRGKTTPSLTNSYLYCLQNEECDLWPLWIMKSMEESFREVLGNRQLKRILAEALFLSILFSLTPFLGWLGSPGLMTFRGIVCAWLRNPTPVRRLQEVVLRNQVYFVNRQLALDWVRIHVSHPLFVFANGLEGLSQGFSLHCKAAQISAGRQHSHCFLRSQRDNFCK